MEVMRQAADDLAWTQGDRFRKAREIAGLTQKQLAIAMETDVATISRYERSKGNPQRRTTMAWAMATGVPLQWLMTGEIEGGSTPPDSVTTTEC